MTTKTKSKKTISIPRDFAPRETIVSSRSLKRTSVFDKASGKMIDVTPAAVKAILPKRRKVVGVPMIAPPGNYPMRISSIAVNPKQVPALKALMARKGIPGYVHNDGTITVDSARELKRHAEGRGFGANNGGYNDPQFRRG